MSKNPSVAMQSNKQGSEVAGNMANDKLSETSKSIKKNPEPQPEIQLDPPQNERGGSIDKKSMASTRQYLEATVVNAVMQGMAELSKQRPDNPLAFLGNYLIEKSKEIEK